MDQDEIDIARHLQMLVQLERFCSVRISQEYYDIIAFNWFNDIAPHKTDEYGLCWKRLGVRGIAGELSGVFYRWTRMIKKGYDLTQPSMFDTVIDAFGYSMLLHCALETTDVVFRENDLVVPRIDHEEILNKLWWDSNSAHAPYISLRMAHNMFRGAQGV